MTNQQIDLVQSSWKKVLPIADTAGMLFYNRLFEIAPEVRPLFGENIEPQAKKLMKMLGMVVGGLTKLDRLIPQVQQLGARHSNYGVQAAHYAVVAQALLWTLEKGLGEAWNEDLKAAWTTAYTTLAGVMKEAQGIS